MIVYDDDHACIYALTIDVPYANTVSISILNHEQRPQAFHVLVQAFLDVGKPLAPRFLTSSSMSQLI